MISQSVKQEIPECKFSCPKMKCFILFFCLFVTLYLSGLSIFIVLLTHPKLWSASDFGPSWISLDTLNRCWILKMSRKSIIMYCSQWLDKLESQNSFVLLESSIIHFALG